MYESKPRGVLLVGFLAEMTASYCDDRPNRPAAEFYQARNEVIATIDQRSKIWKLGNQICNSIGRKPADAKALSIDPNGLAGRRWRNVQQISHCFLLCCDRLTDGEDAKITPGVLLNLAFDLKFREIVRIGDEREVAGRINRDAALVIDLLADIVGADNLDGAGDLRFLEC